METNLGVLTLRLVNRGWVKLVILILRAKVLIKEVGHLEG